MTTQAASAPILDTILDTILGTVVALNRLPVKSMQAEPLQSGRAVLDRRASS